MSALPGYLAAQAAVAQGPLLFSGALSEGQFYSPPESFAGEGCCLGEVPSGRGFARSGVGWVCSLCSFCGLPGESQQPSPACTSLPTSCVCVGPPTSPHSPPPLPIVTRVYALQGLTMNQMTNWSGRKTSLPRYLAARSHPACGAAAPGKGQCWARPGWAGASQRRVDPSSWSAGQCRFECQPPRLPDPLACLWPGSLCGVAAAAAPAPASPRGLTGQASPRAVRSV